MSEDTSVYSQITDPGERLLIFSTYILGTVGITLAMIIIYSLILKNKKLNKSNEYDYYYRYAIKCGILLSICLILFCLQRLIFNDLIIPIDKFVKNNIDFVSLIDSFATIEFSICKLSFYFGFTFIYLSLLKKNKINIYLKILMILMFITTFVIWCGVYFVDDIINESLTEISFTKKRGIYMILQSNPSNNISIDIIFVIAILMDIIYIAVLLYKFIYDFKQIYIKGVVLLCISSIVYIVTMSFFIIDVDIKHLSDSIILITDNICLFLMFKGNQDIYNNFCGCLVAKCCGSKYKTIQTNDNDQDDEDDEQPMIVNI